MRPSTQSLAQRLLPLQESNRFAPALLERFARWVETASEEQLFRVNPLLWAEATGVATRDAIDLFVHAAKAGIFDFAWGFLCRDCGAFINTRNGLKSLQRSRDCGL